MPYMTVGQVAKQIGVTPWFLSQLLYRGGHDDACPIVAGRRQIPESYVAKLEAACERAKRRATSK